MEGYIHSTMYILHDEEIMEQPECLVNVIVRIHTDSGIPGQVGPQILHLFLSCAVSSSLEYFLCIYI